MYKKFVYFQLLFLLSSPFFHLTPCFGVTASFDGEESSVCLRSNLQSSFILRNSEKHVEDVLFASRKKNTSSWKLLGQNFVIHSRVLQYLFVLNDTPEDSAKQVVPLLSIPPPGLM